MTFTVLPVPEHDLAFPLEEYKARQQALASSMESAGLDGIMLFHQESLYYLYGYDQIGYWVYQTVIVPRSGSPVTICRRADELIVRASPWLRDVRVWWDDSPVDPGDITYEVVSDLGLIGYGKRIGIERKAHSLLPFYYDMVRTRLESEVELVDASDLITELRIRKSPRETANVVQAARIMDHAFRAALAGLESGVRECDVHAAVMNAMYAAGGEIPAVPPPISSGPRTLMQTHGGATRRVIATGDAVTIEIGAAFNRYHAVGLRSAFVGEPPSEIVQLHDALVRALEAGLRHLRPGMPAAELARLTLDDLEQSGYDRRRRHVGYGTGIGYPPTWLDSLRIKETDEHVLDPGTTFFYFLGAFSADGNAYLGVGDPILVTDEGPKVLTEIDRRLFIVA
jgi:Xaa-Pro dipeptidase